MQVNALLVVNDVAEYLGVSPDTVRRWAHRGKIRHVILPSGQMRFFPDDLRDYLRVVEVTDRGEVA